MINKLIKILRTRRKERCFRNNATLKGVKYKFGISAGIALLDGSTKEDIVLEDNVWVHGQLHTQNHGKIIFREYSKIGVGCKIECVNYVEIGRYTAIGDNTYISDNNNHPISPDFRKYMRMQPEVDDSRLWKHSDNAPIRIGENCWIGRNVRIQKGVSIGDNSVIAANSIVTKDVPANSIVGGNPARILRTDIDKLGAPTSCKGYNESIKQ